MKIASVKIENYRGIRSLELPLDSRMTVLFGPNGAGKTSILEAVGLGFDPPGHVTDRPVKLDRHQGYLENPRVTLVGEGERVLSCVEGADVGDYWGRIQTPGVFLAPDASADLPLPPFVFYDVDRAVVSGLGGREVGTEPDFTRLFDWLYVKEFEELRLQRDENPTTRLVALSAVRGAICAMLPGVVGARIGMWDPPRLEVSREDNGTERNFAFEQLSDGYQGVLAIAGDIARRLAELDPVRQAEDPLAREILVLIDEVELHLHPAWQQRILADLTRTFPKAQFIVSTHSPQVLTTVHPKHIVELASEDGDIVAGAPAAPTYGAEAGDVLSGVMGVERRPPNEFSEDLTEYMRLVGDDKGETEAALQLRERLEKLSFRDPALQRADLEIRRRKMLRDMDES